MDRPTVETMMMMLTLVLIFLIPASYQALCSALYQALYSVPYRILMFCKPVSADLFASYS